MNPLRLLVLLVSLTLLLGGCGREESVVEIKPIEPVAETKAVEEKQEEVKEEVKTEEGCLSFPNLWLKVSRAETIVA